MLTHSPESFPAAPKSLGETYRQVSEGASKSRVQQSSDASRGFDVLYAPGGLPRAKYFGASGLVFDSVFRVFSGKRRIEASSVPKPSRIEIVRQVAAEDWQQSFW